MIPSGSGMYIWILNRLGTPEQLVASAKEARFNFVNIKVQNGTWVTDGSKQEAEFLAMAPDYISAFTEAGIDVHGWGYLYNASDAELATALRAIDKLSIKSYTMDVEQEFKLVTPTRAKVFVDNLISRSKVPVGFTSYRFPSYHREIAWSAFKPCAFSSPQVYWIGANNPAEQLAKCLGEYHNLGLTMPMSPIGAAYPQGSWSPTVGQIKEFHKSVMDNNLSGWSFWEWAYAESNAPLWGAISALGQVSVPGPVVDPKASKLIVEVKQLVQDVMTKVSQLEEILCN
jgi:hypothetical protein